ncbi:MAG: DUF1579 domain-containing protein [Actinomycetes bacterium]
MFLDGPEMKPGHPALAPLLGHWRGSTVLAAGPWGPERTVDAEVSYTPMAGGTGIVQSYRHVEADGTQFEGHGIFTVDPSHNDVFWYYVDSSNVPPAAPVRCTWHDGVIRAERPSGSGWTRHAISVKAGMLQHVTELRATREPQNEGILNAEAHVVANGQEPRYRPFMRSVFQHA